MKILICGIGHTAAGKTTTLRKLAKKLNCIFISEGAIKRGLIGDSFNVNNSMDEDLRSRGYRIAIQQAFNELKNNTCVIIDASFHQLFRRLWVYDEVRKFDGDVCVIWVYCYCDNIDKVSERITQRANEKVVHADIQARSMEVYHYTMSTFDKVDIVDFPSYIASAIIYNNTNVSEIDKINGNNDFALKKAKEIGDLIYG